MLKLRCDYFVYVYNTLSNMNIVIYQQYNAVDIKYRIILEQVDCCHCSSSVVFVDKRSKSAFVNIIL